MELKFLVSGKHESEMFLSFLLLGIVLALEKELISIDDAEDYIFNPYTVNKLESLGVDEIVTEIIASGCELEDVRSLVPERLMTNIISLKEQIIKNIKAIPRPLLLNEKIIKD